MPTLQTKPIPEGTLALREIFILEVDLTLLHKPLWLCNRDVRLARPSKDARSISFCRILLFNEMRRSSTILLDQIVCDLYRFFFFCWLVHPQWSQVAISLNFTPAGSLAYRLSEAVHITHFLTRSYSMQWLMHSALLVRPQTSPAAVSSICRWHLLTLEFGNLIFINVVNESQRLLCSVR